ncbi:hypothetical protein B4N89_04040 [Embleya scabrispora]|uniref:Uncharacterized protein n=1 Tax=Embleya scabrispora TaxID=159449 RepID=A0A1T3P6W2_9ACTN|nr:hypothetical protein B4N89_04040 [Embleya scabrispora]
MYARETSDEAQIRRVEASPRLFCGIAAPRAHLFPRQGECHVDSQVCRSACRIAGIPFRVRCGIFQRMRTGGTDGPGGRLPIGWV